MRRLSSHVVVASWCALSAIPTPLGYGIRAAEPASVRSPWTADDLWLTPASAPALGSAVGALADGNAALAHAAFGRAAGDPIIGGYARLYQGRAELALDRAPAAASSARQVLASAVSPTLREEALWLLADALERSDQWAEASKALQSLLALPSRNLAAAYLRLGRAAFKADETVVAVQAFTTLYYDLPRAPEARDAEDELKRHYHWPPATDTFARADRRAESLFAGRQYDRAKKAFEALLASAPEAERQRVKLRLAQCDLQLGRYGPARDALRAYLDTATERPDDAAYAMLGAVRGLGRGAEYVALTRQFVAAHPGSALAEAALNDLATYHILANQDAEAVAVFREILQKHPQGAFAERAVWKAGWAAFRGGDYQGAIALFDPAVDDFPRSDYRPSWLYWSARAHERLGHAGMARDGFQRTVSAYRNSYYGRQASAALAAMRPAAVAVRTSGPNDDGAEPAASPLLSIGVAPPPDNAPLIRALLAAELYDAAILEIRSAQAGNPSKLLDATLAYALHRKGELRPAIIAMRRAYPEFIADGGEALPADLLRVIYPLDYWELIRRHAAPRKLDPYLMAALIAQESTFQTGVRSHANAWGLMQILPSTGRRVAPVVGVRGFTTVKLTDPDVNIRIGMKYFQDLLARFGGDVAPALAAYNAGESRVVRWLAERPGLSPDEFIDDIPFPETQNYVKRIIGTAEDYRTLYGTFASGGSAIVRRSAR
ncbi:MAG: transglycosylase SLT domain-containing protein [Acidobacteria bacterium]|nr:transglycosylase SLT domain-containing protein [Acidobacteriota bacterium]